MWPIPIVTIGCFPLVSKANLEFNKEGLAADLVCLLEERSSKQGKVPGTD